jgi:hypothetical protein
LEKQKMKEQLTARLVDGRAIEEGSTLQTSAEERRRRGVGALAKGGGATAREAAAARERG